jgi:fructose-1,6-bisphosphatase/inositol monophosphatase family enzyme
VIDKVDALLREVAAEVVLPRYQRLTHDEVQEKGPGDLVTVADREAERLLTTRLTDLLPGSVVVGEEAVSADPSLMSHLTREHQVWVVDPLDGTTNFAAGRRPFAMMVALLRDGRTVASWILDPVDGVLASAERGGGAYLGGERIVFESGARPLAALRGPVFGKYIPPDARALIAQGEPGVGEVLRGHNCAGYEYPAIARDDQQFAVFWRMLPWDHAPGTLLIAEAGGTARYFDGAAYDPTSSRAGVLVARSPEVWDLVRGSLLAHL